MILPQQLEGMGLQLGAEACFDSVSLEYRLGSGEEGTEIVADAYGHGAIDMVIEIAVHNPVGHDKAEKIRRLGLPAVEIVLTNAVSSFWDWEALRHAVVTDPLRRRWINLPEPELVAEQRPRTASAQLIWEFNIRGARVVARKLPFGNFSVWHAFDSDVREVVEGACRGRGKWQSKYRNWVVFDRFWPEVFATLLSADQQREQAR